MFYMRRSRTTSRWWLLPLAGLLTLGVWGCGSKPQYGDKKSDWVKTTPPPTWRGPGQPGGPPAAALNGPKTPPPGTAANQTPSAAPAVTR